MTYKSFIIFYLTVISLFFTQNVWSVSRSAGKKIASKVQDDKTNQRKIYTYEHDNRKFVITKNKNNTLDIKVTYLGNPPKVLMKRKGVNKSQAQWNLWVEKLFDIARMADKKENNEKEIKNSLDVISYKANDFNIKDKKLSDLREKVKNVIAKDYKKLMKKPQDKAKFLSEINKINTSNTTPFTANLNLTKKLDQYLKPGMRYRIVKKIEDDRYKKNKDYKEKEKFVRYILKKNKVDLKTIDSRDLTKNDPQTKLIKKLYYNYTHDENFMGDIGRNGVLKDNKVTKVQSYYEDYLRDRAKQSKDPHKLGVQHLDAAAFRACIVSKIRTGKIESEFLRKVRDEKYSRKLWRGIHMASSIEDIKKEIMNHAFLLSDERKKNKNIFRQDFEECERFVKKVASVQYEYATMAGKSGNIKYVDDEYYKYKVIMNDRSQHVSLFRTGSGRSLILKQSSDNKKTINAQYFSGKNEKIKLVGLQSKNQLYNKFNYYLKKNDLKKLRWSDMGEQSSLHKNLEQQKIISSKKQKNLIRGIARKGIKKDSEHGLTLTYTKKGNATITSKENADGTKEVKYKLGNQVVEKKYYQAPNDNKVTEEVSYQDTQGKELYKRKSRLTLEDSKKAFNVAKKIANDKNKIGERKVSDTLLRGKFFTQKLIEPKDHHTGRVFNKLDTKKLRIKLKNDFSRLSQLQKDLKANKNNPKEKKKIATQITTITKNIDQKKDFLNYLENSEKRIQQNIQEEEEKARKFLREYRKRIKNCDLMRENYNVCKKGHKDQQEHCPMNESISCDGKGRDLLTGNVDPSVAKVTQFKKIYSLKGIRTACLVKKEGFPKGSYPTVQQVRDAFNAKISTPKNKKSMIYKIRKQCEIVDQMGSVSAWNSTPDIQNVDFYEEVKVYKRYRGNSLVHIDFGDDSGEKGSYPQCFYTQTPKALFVKSCHGANKPLAVCYAQRANCSFGEGSNEKNFPVNLTCAAIDHEKGICPSANKCARDLSVVNQFYVGQDVKVKERSSSAVGEK